MGIIQNVISMIRKKREEPTKTDIQSMIDFEKEKLIRERRIDLIKRFEKEKFLNPNSDWSQND